MRILSWPLAQVGGGAPADWAQFENAWLVVLIYMGLVAVGVVVGIVLLVRMDRRPPDWGHLAARLAQRPWRWLDAIRLVALLIGLHLAAILVFRLLGGGSVPDAEPDYGPSLLIQSVIFHWAALIFIVVALRSKSVSWRRAFGGVSGSFSRQVGLGIAFYLSVLPFTWFYSVLYETSLKYLGYQPRLQEVAWAVTSNYSWGMRLYLLSLAVVLAPVLEELLFRGIGLPLFARRMGVGFAVFLVSAVFAAIHTDLPAVVPLFIVAVAFSLAYLYSGSIVVPVVMHMMFNGVNLALLLLLRYA